MTSRYPLLRHLHSGRLLGLALVAMPGLAAPALAEERDPFAPLPPLPLLREGVAGTRQIPGYIAPGVRAGAVLLSPQITARTDADSNVLTTRTGKQGDVAVAIAPAMVAGVDLADLHMSFSAQAEALRYARLTEQNRETFALQAQAAPPSGRALQLGASLGWSLKDEPNYTASAADGDGPTRYHQLAGTLGLAAAFGPNRIAATLDFDRYDYLAVFRSGQMISQSFRDQRVLTAGLRAEHGLPGGKTLFVQADYSRADSRRPTPAFDRSWRGGEALAGIRGDLTPLVSVELAAGYDWRNYRSPAYRNWGGLAYRAKAEWYATPLISLQAVSRRDMVDAGLPGSAGVVVDSGQVRVFYEVRRNLNLVASTGFSHESYRDGPAAGLTARNVSAGLEAKYALSSRYLVGAYARYRNRSSASPLLARLGGAVEGGLSLRLKL
jgi:hypothetical protein